MTGRPLIMLVLYGALLAFTLFLRMALQWWRTGRTGFNAFKGGPLGKLVGSLLSLAFVLGFASPVLTWRGVVRPVATLPPWVDVLGYALTALGLVGTFASQLAMGASWRIGVDPEERTRLVTGGPFGVVRNPIFTLVSVAALGLTILLPTIPSLLALAALVLGIVIEVRAIEEPYLRRVHGEVYEQYCRSVGRFVPRLGRQT